MDRIATPVKLAIAGAAGRMGRALLQAAVGDPRFRLMAATEQPGSAVIGTDVSALIGGDALGVPVLDDARLAADGADVFVDFTRPIASLDALQAFGRAAHPALVLGTTGFSAAEQDMIIGHARTRPIVQAANFGVGVNVLLGLVHKAAQILGPDWDLEITESHHRHKRDAPSGTALAIGHAAARGRNALLDDLREGPREGQTRERRRGAIGFAIRRAGGIIGDHEAAFVNEDEAVYLGHRALSRSLFAEGALRAAIWVRDRAPGLYSMQEVLGFGRSEPDMPSPDMSPSEQKGPV